MATIVALSGWKGSGKDLVADYLVKNHGFKRISFADPLKDNVAEQYKLNRASLDDQNQKELPILDRPTIFTDGFSQSVGSFMFKEFRGENGAVPSDFLIEEDGNMLGISGRATFQLYWTRRALCILEGSSKRTTDKDYWVKQAASKMTNGRYVIADVRYKNELGALFRASPNSVIAVRIERFSTSPSSDPSERDLDEYSFPFRIDNTGRMTKEDVYSQLENILQIKQVTTDESES